MVNYNPNAPLTCGIEWLASRIRNDPLGYFLGQAALIDVTSTQTFDTVKMALNVPVGQPGIDDSKARVGVDIYNAATMMNYGVLQTAYTVPAADSTITSGWVRSDNLASSANLWQMVADAPGAEGGTAAYFLASPTNGGFGVIRFKAGTQWKDRTTGANVDISAKRILQVYISVAVATNNPVPPAMTTVLNMGTGEIRGDQMGNATALVAPNQPAQILFADGYNQAFHRNFEPWRATDADQIETTGPGDFGITVSGVYGGSGYSFALNGIQINVVYATETRLATGWASVPRTLKDAVWASIPLVNTANGAALPSLTKTSGTQLAVVARTTPKTGNGVTWRSLDTSQTADHSTDVLTGIRQFAVPMFENDLPANGAPDASLAPFSAPSVYLLNAGTVRVDGTGYVTTASVALSAGFPIQQEFSNATATPYGLLSALILNNAAAHATSGPLVLQVFRRSDNAPMTSAVSITAADLPPVDNRWVLITKRSLTGNVTLASGIQYYINASTTATGANPWQVALLGSVTAEAGGRGFGGTTDAITTAIGEFTTSDAVLQARFVPATLSGLTATLFPLDTTRGLVGSCVVPSVNGVFLNWTPSALGASFARYEIERRNPVSTQGDPDTNWYRIANLPNVTTPPLGASFFDFECRRNVLQEWRIRQVATDGSVSDWASFPQLTVPAGQWDLILATNFNPLATVGCKDAPGYEWRPVDNPVVLPLYGVDKQVAFRETERRGEEQTRKLLLAFNELGPAVFPTHGGRFIFDVLDTLFDTPGSPYTALCDGRGRRWFTSPHVDAYTEEEPLGRYTATVTFTEVHGPTPG